MLSFVYLLRTIYSFTRNGKLDSKSVLNALLSVSSLYFDLKKKKKINYSSVFNTSSKSMDSPINDG